MAPLLCRLQGGESLVAQIQGLGAGSAKLMSDLFAECGLESDASDRGAMDAKVGQFAAGQGLQFGDCFAVQGTFGHLLTQSGPARYESQR